MGDLERDRPGLFIGTGVGVGGEGIAVGGVPGRPLRTSGLVVVSLVIDRDRSITERCVTGGTGGIVSSLRPKSGEGSPIRERSVVSSRTLVAVRIVVSVRIVASVVGIVVVAVGAGGGPGGRGPGGAGGTSGGGFCGGVSLGSSSYVMSVVSPSSVQGRKLPSPSS